jgi:hypothetical protein
MSFIIFIFLTINYYFSEENIVYINKSRSSYALTLYNNLPLLKNDTNNIIVYKNDLEEFKKKRKKRFWEKLISDDN